MLIEEDAGDRSKIASLGEVANNLDLAFRSDSWNLLTIEFELTVEFVLADPTTISGYKARMWVTIAESGGFGRRTETKEMLTNRDCKIC